MNLNRKQNASQLGEKLPPLPATATQSYNLFQVTLQHVVSTTRPHVLLGMSKLLPYFSEKKFGKYEHSKSGL